MKVLTLKHERVGAFELEVYETVYECPEFSDYKKYVYEYCHNALVRTRKELKIYAKLIDETERKINELGVTRENLTTLAQMQRNIDNYMNPFKCLTERFQHLSELEDFIMNEAPTYEKIKSALDYFDERYDDEDMDCKVGFYRLSWEEIDGYDNFRKELRYEGREE